MDSMFCILLEVLHLLFFLQLTSLPGSAKMIASFSYYCVHSSLTRALTDLSIIFSLTYKHKLWAIELNLKTYVAYLGRVTTSSDF